MDLDESRETIRAIDEQIASLFVERMEAARDIAAYKQEQGLPVEDEELRPFYLEFLQNTMDVSKSWQRHLMQANAKVDADGQKHDDAPGGLPA